MRRARAVGCLTGACSVLILAAAGLAQELPTVWLEAKDSFSRDKAASCTMILAAAGEQRATGTARQGSIRLRGSSSLGYPKKSYALTFDQPVGLIDLPAHRNWILNAAFIDRSFMRHKLSYDLFRSLSKPDRPRFAAASRFVEVHLNGAYQGLYLLMERVDEELANLPPFRKEDAEHTAIYKAIDHEAGFVHGGHNGFEQVVPDPKLMAYWQPLDALMQFIRTSPADKFFNADSGIAKQLDLDNAIDFHLLVLVTGNADGITKNFYLARPRPAAGSTARFFFIPWDYDGSFGQNWDASPLPVELWLTNRLFERLLQNADYRARFAARWMELRDKPFAPASIHALIDANVKTIAPAVARNATRWAAAQNRYPNRLTFEQDVEQMKTWVTRHLAWLDKTIMRRARK